MDESKRIMLEHLRNQFINFINNIISMPGSSIQKQQALLRFDEGHMWLQNAIMSHEEPKQDNTDNEVTQDEVA